MTDKANPTDAKTIAFHFLELTTDGRNTKAVIAKTINQVKNLMNVGYTKEEIIATIDYVHTKGTKVFSFGYYSTAIADVLTEINKRTLSSDVEKVKEELVEMEKKAMEEVNTANESTERNRQRLSKFGLQSREREKHYLDLFERQ
jgi:hypothetical protein